MIAIDRITAVITLLGGATLIPVAAQTLLIPTLVAWESEVAATFLRSLPVG